MRRRLVLLNACISGAILLAMALAGLRVAQNVLTAQYERDLARNTAQMIATISSAPEGEAVQFAANYTLYQAEGGKVRIIGTQQVTAGEIQQMAEQVRAQLEVGETEQAADISLMWHAAAPTSDVLVQRFYVSTPDAARLSGINAGAIDITTAVSSEDAAPAAEDAMYFEAPLIKVAQRQNVLVDAAGASYRVEVPIATKGASGADQLLMVFQNRSDELSALNNLRMLFFGCALAGLVLTGAASLFLSARSIRPVEQSIKAQREFVAAASHELRTPVAAVRANAEVLQDADLGDFGPYLESIEQESGRMSHLVQDLMNLARADADGIQLKSEPVELSEVADPTVAAMRPLADRRGIEITESLSPALVKADPDRLRQALVALLDNAIRYTQPGGHICVSAARQGSHALLTVADDGPGIPAEHKMRVFERFYRISPDRGADGGCGLGLPVAQQLVQKMGGTISLRDAPGGGCLFTIRFRALK